MSCLSVLFLLKKNTIKNYDYLGHNNPDRRLKNTSSYAQFMEAEKNILPLNFKSTIGNIPSEGTLSVIILSFKKKILSSYVRPITKFNSWANVFDNMVWSAELDKPKIQVC